MGFYEAKYRDLIRNNVTAVFAESDFYALELIKRESTREL